MLVIRLARTGKKKQAYYRIVVADKRRAVGAKFIEILGNYNPHQKTFEINEEKLGEYLKNGAQPSNTLAKLLKSKGVKLPSWVVITERNRPAKKAEEKAESAPAVEEKSKEEAMPAAGSESVESIEPATSTEAAPEKDNYPADAQDADKPAEETKVDKNEEPKNISEEAEDQKASS